MAILLVFVVAARGDTLYMTSSVPGTFVDISTTGTPLGLADEGIAEITPGFSLAQTLFSGDGSGRVWISNNGAVGFLADGSSGVFYLNQPRPSSSLFGDGHGAPQALAAYWDDLDSDTGDPGAPCGPNSPGRVPPSSRGKRGSRAYNQQTSGRARTGPGRGRAGLG